ncbi:hypothetical protein RFI_25715 [Reticulomyxa filosa]|uniref:Uncharacterized protein n=1 Tax=Reticulomyxa filosa TaxID=46433 RepID=X6MDA5_RETFI|nr:hypothetical protein RFI_25715 [Reticulomyxa filosa]|eukprot:ETO11661.1 hypothetical protein RFI_25715 [Reticulomyxa filosa]
MVKEVSLQKAMIVIEEKVGFKNQTLQLFFLIDLTFSLQNEMVITKGLRHIKKEYKSCICVMCQDQVQGPIDNNELVDAEDLFAIEERVTIETFPEQATWLKVVSKLNGSKENKEKEEHVKVIYPVSTGRGVQVTANDLKTQDPQKYVGIPDDHLKISLIDVSLPKDVIILVERDNKSQ